MSLQVAKLSPADRAAWEPLARGYKAFYETPITDAELERAWQWLMEDRQVHGLGAYLDGELVGLVHFLFHGSTWAPQVCYLQDLFTAPAARGRGVGEALIEAVAAEAVRRGAGRCYWLTQDHNRVARGLYDKLAEHRGFIRYDYPLPAVPA
ncbi:GNAT family N-acetyltransferase [Pelomonas sp. SE-A7]|uniref:GNAT family N-acetyltransferase n=1 Tax=Pelomonas sp. SE-A7 TaxID=3054953 RepID=UPI00259CF08B|nr:GNAT family N-acetyltransferase [Pelomonas sp. SE-A7]MDM4768063.1 GNAT family N-acetyltransferase [Pelomonas sp. SE-A7]